MKPRKRADLMLACPVLLAAIAILIIAGCTDAVPDQQDQAPALSETPHENPAAAGKNNPTTRAPTQPAPVRSTSVPDTSLPYITFDPVGDKNIGDLLVFSGTTNLPEKTPLYCSWAVGDAGEERTVANNRPVFTGTDGTNRWRFVFDSGSLEPGRYSVTVGTGKNAIAGSSQFTLTGTALRPKTLVYYSGDTKIPGGTPTITVSPIGDHHEGDVFVISGLSGLEKGTALLCSIYPAYYEDRSKRPGISNGSSGIGIGTVVIRGAGRSNRWAVALDTRGYEKTEYIVNVSTISADFTVREIFGRTAFTLT